MGLSFVGFYILFLFTFPSVFSSPCSFNGVVSLVFNNKKPTLFVEMKPSNDLTFFHSLKTGSKLEVPIQVDNYPLSSEQQLDITKQFQMVCDGQEQASNLDWGKDSCTDDLYMQLDIYLKRVCLYQPRPSLQTTFPSVSRLRLSFSDRQHVIDYIRQQKEFVKPNYTVIDVGGSYGGWSFKVINAIVDRNSIKDYQSNNITLFDANINFESGWDSILQHVDKFGKFDFAICSHTLEDLAFPQVTLNMLPNIAVEGFVAVPSKFRELSFGVEGVWQGYHHHRWICTFRNGIFKLYPKLGFLEHYTTLSTAVADASDGLFDLGFFWHHKLPYSIINDDFVGPSLMHAFDYYSELFWDDLDALRAQKKT